MKYLVHYPLPPETMREINSYLMRLGRPKPLYPHSTIMAFYGKEESLRPIREKVAFVANRHGSSLTKTIGAQRFFNATESIDDTLVLELARSPAMLRLHLDVVRQLGAYIDWRAMPRIPTDGPAAEWRYRRFGSPWFGEAWRPHISVGKGTTLPPAPRLHFPLDTIVLAVKPAKESPWTPVGTYPLIGRMMED
jgi:hypothetical protein